MKKVILEDVMLSISNKAGWNGIKEERRLESKSMVLVNGQT